MMQNAKLDNIRRATPAWLPQKVLIYIAHAKFGFSMRQIARDLGIQPSTVSRNVKKISDSLSDPLFQSGVESVTYFIQGVCQSALQCPDAVQGKNSAVLKKDRTLLVEDNFQQDSRKLLLELSKPGAFLAISLDLKSSLIANDNKSIHGSVKPIDRALVEAFSLKGWLQLDRNGEIISYFLASDARSYLGRWHAINVKNKNYLHKKNSVLRTLRRDATFVPETKLRPRSLAVQKKNTESPLSALARLPDKFGDMFLSSESVVAGQLFREDFELANLIVATKGNNEKFLALSGKTTGTMQFKSLLNIDPASRLARALSFLGPELFDVAMRCCCHFQGMQQIEKELGWSARSGKIVLRIALTQLAVFYEIKEPSHRSKELCQTELTLGEQGSLTVSRLGKTSLHSSF